MPVLLTTQNAVKFGQSVSSIKSRLPEGTPEFDKVRSALLIPEILEYLEQENIQDVALVDIETHVCVAQTALEILEHGYKVAILADAVSSSSAQERMLALQRMLSAGTIINSVEAWAYEALRSAQHPSFVSASTLLEEIRLENGDFEANL
ncbi:Isochorismatase-like protein [Aspergillus alliaceus]|uniref:Isochorismatase-like protein n=1 Tax=Petromyces alliaceus TaxID=209559 RepID=A0A5N7BUY2_PETAA|nr:Isochorismatase-like protein [Aspergillus alliaceus]